MDVIKRRLKQLDGKFREQEFLIFTKEEADERRLTYWPDWRDCLAGDWGLTDDGYVMQCRGFAELAATRKNKASGIRKVKEHLRKRYYKFAVGEPIVTHNTNTSHTNKPSFAYLPYKELGGYSHAKAKTWQAHNASRDRVKKAISLYVDFHVSESGKVTTKQLGAVADLYKPGAKHRVLDFKDFLKSEEGNRLFMEKLKEALEHRGITYDSALTKMDETYLIAVGTNNAQVMRGVYRDQFDLINKAEGDTGKSDDSFDFSLLASKIENELLSEGSMEELVEIEIITNGEENAQ